MVRPNKSGIEWGAKVEIKNWRMAGLEMVLMPKGIAFLIQPSFNEHGINEEQTKVYLDLKLGGYYREVLGAKKNEVIVHYKERGAMEA